MNGRAVWAIVRKDLKVVLQNRGVLLPIVIVPLVFFVVLPVVAAAAPRLIHLAGASLDQLDQLLARMPQSLQQELGVYSAEQKTIILFLGYLMAPLFLILPLMAASVIAADSFAGERERKTLEALLYTPTTDRELFTGKLLAPWLAAVAVALAGFVLYSVAANAAAWPVMGRVFFPSAMWVVLLVWVVPAVAGLGLGVMVLVSARAQGFQDAYQIGSVVVVPVLLLVAGQVSGVLVFNVGVVFLLGLALWLIDGLLLWLGNRGFRRGQLIARV
jgi:ABC-2 type transport system permease protein